MAVADPRLDVEDPEGAGTDPNQDPERTTPDPASVGASYATQQELAELKQQLTQSQQTNDLLRQLIDSNAPRNAPTQEPSDPPIEDVTDEQLVEALRSGTEQDVARLFRKANNAASERATRAVRKELQELRHSGVSTFARMSSELTSSKMPLLQEFPEIKQAYDTELKQIPDDWKANPDYLMSLYSRIVGQHIDLIAQRKVEAAIRKAREPEQPSMPTTSNGRGAPSPQDSVPDVTSIAGQAGARLLQEKGLNGDAFAQRLGYESWEAYMKFADENEGPVQ